MESGQQIVDQNDKQQQLQSLYSAGLDLLLQFPELLHILIPSPL